MNNKGFTIIELMIAVAIVGILAAIAVPQYNSYLNRSKTSEAFTMSSPYKMAIAECLQNGNSIDKCQSGNNSIPHQIEGKYGNIKAKAGAAIYKFNAKDIKLDGTIISLQAVENHNSISWICKYKLSDHTKDSGIESDIFPSSAECSEDNQLVF